MLEINDLHAYYGKSHVLHGVTFQVGKGEIVALMGRNGSGRSTTAKAIMGMVDCKGVVRWKGQSIVGKKAFEIAHLGLGLVPESRDIFPKLTVYQNLLLGQKGSGKGSRWSFDDMYAIFPRLKEREHTEAGVLSGGEQQMLAIARALVARPALLLADEPTGNLDSHSSEDVFALFRRSNEKFGCAVLLVTHDERISNACDRVITLEDGRIVSGASI